MEEIKEIIETGADKLIALIRKKEQVSMKEAAKELGVSFEVIEEWANFLEQEGIVSIDYKVTTPYITVKKLSKKELEEKIKDFKESKDLLLGKACSTLDFLDSQGDEIKKVKKEFENLKEEVDTDFKSVKKSLII